MKNIFEADLHENGATYTYKENRSSPEELLTEAKKASKKNIAIKTIIVIVGFVICTIFVICAAFLLPPNHFGSQVIIIGSGCIFPFIGAIIAKANISFYKIEVKYTFDRYGKYAAEYEKIHEGFMRFCDNCEHWGLNNFTDDSVGQACGNIFVEDKFGSTIKFNIKVCQIKRSKECIIFLPDIVLYKNYKEWNIFEYKDMQVGYETFNKEHIIVPQDARILNKWYKHSNKDGSRDLRYLPKNNPMITLCEYGKVEIKHLDSGLVNMNGSSSEKMKECYNLLKSAINSLSH